MSILSVPKLALLGLGLAGVLKVSVDLVPADLFMGAQQDAGLSQPRPERLVMAAMAAPAPEASDMSSDISADASQPGESGMCEPGEAIAAAIAEERGLLEVQRKELSDREARIALAEESLRTEQERLAEVRDEIAAQLERIEKANNQDMTKLVELYRNMKPQVAAGIMDEIDIETAVLVIAAMPERDAAQVVGELSLVRARLITKIILEQSKLPADRNLEGLRLR